MNRELWDKLPTAAWMSITDRLTYWDVLAAAEVFPSLERLMSSGWGAAMRKSRTVVFVTRTVDRATTWDLRTAISLLDGRVHAENGLAVVMYDHLGCPVGLECKEGIITKVYRSRGLFYYGLDLAWKAGVESLEDHALRVLNDRLRRTFNMHVVRSCDLSIRIPTWTTVELTEEKLLLEPRWKKLTLSVQATDDGICITGWK